MVMTERPLHSRKIPQRAANKANIVSACDICGSVAYINGLVPDTPISRFFFFLILFGTLRCFCTVNIRNMCSWRVSRSGTKTNPTELTLRGAAHAPDILVSRDGARHPRAGQTSDCQPSEECRGSCNSTVLQQTWEKWVC